MPSVTRRYESEQYDGTNGSYLTETFCPSVKLISDTGAALVFQDGDGGQHTVKLNDYLVRQSNTNDPFPIVETPASYVLNWIE